MIFGEPNGADSREKDVINKHLKDGHKITDRLGLGVYSVPD